VLLGVAGRAWYSNGMWSSIIPTKIIIPHSSPGLIRRPRLIDFVHENLTRKLLLITAPAGYGKTTLLIDFAGDAGLPICWLTLDEIDRDPRTFVMYLIAAIRQKFPNFGKRSMPLVEHGLSSARAAAAALVADLLDDVPEFFALVLDDWQLVGDEPLIAELLDQLLRYLPEHAHLIVAGRTLLQGPLVRLTAQGAVAGLGPGDLRFMPDEVQQVLADRYRVHITAEQATQLAQESEGWITAIVLSSAKGNWQMFLSGLARARESSSTLFEYLAGEVFEQLPPDLRRFLWAAAVPRQFTVGLCDAVRGEFDSRLWIEQAEARNLFITRIPLEQETWFRFHNLFRDFLLARFQRDDPGGYAELQRRAGELLVARDEVEEAVEHFLRAGAPERAVQIIDGCARSLFISGRIETLHRWARTLPAEHRAAAPDLILYEGQALSDRGQSQEALALLREAQVVFAARADRTGELRALALQGWAYQARGQLSEALAIGQQIAQDPVIESFENALLRAQALRLLGACYSGMGQWSLAEQYLSQALALYRAAPQDERRSYNLGRTLQDLANALRALGRLEEAAALQVESLALWREVGNPSSLAVCLNNIGYDRNVAGDYTGALRWYAEALNKAEEVGDQRVQIWILEGKAATYRDRGEFDLSLETYAQVFGLTGAVADQAQVSWALDGLGHTHRLAGDPDRALALFEQARNIALRDGNRAQVNVSTASIGVAHIELGEISGLDALEQAAEALRQANAYLDLARVTLWLAHGRYVWRQEDRAREALQEMMRLSRRLGCCPFSQAEGRHVLAFLEWCAGQLPEEPRLQQWLGTVKATLVPAIEIEPTPAAASRLEVRAFGAGQVWRDGQPLGAADWGRSANARDLLFFLLEHTPCSKEVIGAQFWPDLTAARMTSSFHAAKYRARRALGVDFVMYLDDQYRIDPKLTLWYDVAEFQRLTDMMDTVQPSAEQIEALRQAVGLYTADYLIGVEAEWAMDIRLALQARFGIAVSRLITLLVGEGRYTEAVEVCRQGLAVDFLHEDWHRTLMLSLALAGRAAEATFHYETMTRRFAQMDVPISAETRTIARQVRSGRISRFDFT
jgi:LuxR family transcriptional regulator, maltose regulon positive regulatory protein